MFRRKKTLTAMARTCGWAGKIGPAVLSDVLRGLTSVRDPELLVGYETSDDAAVYRLSADLAVISTVDFITPPVDDPAWFGRIAAANALSDVYAMGGRPMLALNLVMFPAAEMGAEVLSEVLRGGLEKTAEAGATIAGGHSVEDREPKYGLAVTGVVHPERLWTNCRALPGDALVMTKPLGTGVLFNACRSGKLPASELLPLLPEIAALNRRAAEVASGFDVHAATDVTGFGLAGHALEVARGSRVAIAFDVSALPVYPLAREMYRQGQSTGANRANRALVAGALDIGARSAAGDQELLFDPQTSGGLLLSVPGAQADDLARTLRSAGVSAAARVAEVFEDPSGLGRLTLRWGGVPRGQTGKGSGREAWPLDFPFATAVLERVPVYVFVVTIGELRRGVELIRHRGDLGQADLLNVWLAQVLVDYRECLLEFGEEAAQVWGRLRVPRSENALDKQIAATALVYDLTVVTRSDRDFAQKGVRVLNPFTDAQ